jgi:hypothetical protein
MCVASVQIDTVGMYVDDRDIPISVAVDGINWHYITDMNESFKSDYILTLNLHVLNHTAVGIDDDDDVIGDKQVHIGCQSSA